MYQISYKGTEDILLGFSKIFDHPENKAPYIAITTCDNADENCPYIADATEHFTYLTPILKKQMELYNKKMPTEKQVRSSLPKSTLSLI